MTCLNRMGNKPIGRQGVIGIDTDDDERDLRRARPARATEVPMLASPERIWRALREK